MRSLFAFLGGALVTFLGLGWYFNWYTITRQPGPPGHSRFEVDFNRQKISDTIKAGEQKIGDLVNRNAPAPAAPK